MAKDNNPAGKPGKRTAKVKARGPGSRSTGCGGGTNGLLPAKFADWFQSRGWQPRAHQIALLERVKSRDPTLLIAPTGAGKTLAGFLPSLVELSGRQKTDVQGAGQGAGLHTLYISPLKALSVDVARNLGAPIREMGLKIACETRTGDTPVGRRSRQRVKPPQILLTTPEQVALLLAHPDASFLFADVRTVILDELHAISGSKRGDLLSLDLARLRSLAPDLITIGLSATVARPSELRAYLVGQDEPDLQVAMADVVFAQGGAKPEISILEVDEPAPWSGHSARYAMQGVYEAIDRHNLTLIFVNTRMQAELTFQELWRINDKDLRIALHHGSLDINQRRKVEAAMAKGALDGVVATSTLDLGIDWGDVDLVIHVGAPKGSSRLLQRIGRSNHRLDEPSRALLVPGNRFEVLECQAALEAAHAGVQDVALSRSGGLDVLAQHVLGMACQAPFNPDQMFHEVRSASPYAFVDRKTFDRVTEFVSTGGYALKAYERYAKLRPTEDGRLRIANAKVAQGYRMNAGTIVDTPMIKVRLVGRRGKAGAAQGRTVGPAAARSLGGRAEKPLVGGRVLGEVDEGFIEQLTPGQAFVFAGETLRFEGLKQTEAFVSRAVASDPIVPSYVGGKFPLSTHLAKRVRAMLQDPEAWQQLPLPVGEWLGLQEAYSTLPGANEVLVETFPKAQRFHLVAYPFEGRLAHQTLGMLLTRRLERAEAMPMGFVANDYGLSIWGRRDMGEMIEDGRIRLDRLFEVDMLGDDLEAWLTESILMKRTFRHCAVISGLIERRHPGKEKSGRQVTMSTDLLYDVLMKHDPGHILLEAARADAATGLLDIGRLGDFLGRIRGAICYRRLSRVSPLSVPILLEIGREIVGQQGREGLLRDAALDLIGEAMGEGPAGNK
ncbi:MAG: ligase-associated DNA damage response DEXH box helicase [Alphaproteobacteria bacterium]|nr:ligase-associated DNA damage response DEXH box helicase [Alphaproteobacteria bacterium]